MPWSRCLPANDSLLLFVEVVLDLAEHLGTCNRLADPSIHECYVTEEFQVVGIKLLSTHYLFKRCDLVMTHRTMQPLGHNFLCTCYFEAFCGGSASITSSTNPPFSSRLLLVRHLRLLLELIAKRGREFLGSPCCFAV